MANTRNYFLTKVHIDFIATKDTDIITKVIGNQHNISIFMLFENKPSKLKYKVIPDSSEKPNSRENLYSKYLLYK
jgi:hypothetical protein